MVNSFLMRGAEEAKPVMCQERHVVNAGARSRPSWRVCAPGLCGIACNAYLSQHE